MNNFIDNEIKMAFENLPDVDKLKNSLILVTGGTGLIGSSVLRLLSYTNTELNLNMTIYGMARNCSKVLEMKFDESISWIYRELNDNSSLDIKPNYIIHTASPTDSKYFITNPVETINDTMMGLNTILKLGKESKSVVFLSSMEVYGVCLEDVFLSEDKSYPIDQLNVRNSYSEGKRMLECICASYADEYSVPVKIIRLCQTFGPGITGKDSRVFAQFGKSIANSENIVLATKGETKRSYCSVADAVVGIIVTLLYGENGEAYNLASENSYCSIYEMAQLFTKNTNSKIVIDEKEDNKYLKTIKFGLDTSKIKNIGFRSIDSIDEIVDRFKNYYCSLLKKCEN